MNDLERSLAFYRDGLGLPTKGIVGQEFEHGAVAFFTHERRPNSRAVASQLSIGHIVRSREDVDAVMKQAEKAGAVITDPPHDRFCGGYSGYFHDPDGHLWEIAWNPQFTVVD